MHCIKQSDFHSHPLLTRLLELHDIPKELYIEGALPEVAIDEYGRSTPRILTVIGSRKHTTYGKQAVEKLIASLKGHDVIVLSGLALGIDGLAHKAALTSGNKTIAIPGSGLDRNVLYPSSHIELAKDILSYDGALISELEPTTSAAPWTFPLRNRLMAALSDALLIIEAEEKSGTLITARLGLELGKDIGAVPGEIFSQNSKGTNALIRDGAYLITNEEDLLALLHLSNTKKEGGEQKNIADSLNEHEKKILEILIEPLDRDTLFERSNMSYDIFLTAFSTLEIEGYLQETFGEVKRLV